MDPKVGDATQVKAEEEKEEKEALSALAAKKKQGIIRWHAYGPL